MLRNFFEKSELYILDLTIKINLEDVDQYEGCIKLPYITFSTSKHARARTSIKYTRCVDGFLALVIVLWYFGEKFLK
jgi:hypothetical protein